MSLLPIGSAGGDGASECEFVGVFEFATEGDAAGEGGDVDGKFGELFGEVKYGGFAVDGGADCHDDFFGFAFLDALYEGGDVEFGGSDTFDGGDDSAEDVKQAAILVGVFDCHDIAQALDDTDEGAVACFVAAYRAYGLVGNVVTGAAKLYIISHFEDGFAEEFGGLGGHVEQVQGKAQGGFFANAR